MSKATLRGPQRHGSGVLDEGALTQRVLAEFLVLDEAEAKVQGPVAAAAVLPLRRALWRLAEALVPERLAVALRESYPAPGPAAKPSAVHELRQAIADWLDPPPRCRRCGRALRPGEPSPAVCGSPPRRRRARRNCTAQDHNEHGPLFAWRPGRRKGGDRGKTPPPQARRPRASDHVQFGAAARKAAAAAPTPTVRKPRPCVPETPSQVARRTRRCGTLALFPVHLESERVRRVAEEADPGAARGHDVACDRDGRALLAATDPTAVDVVPAVVRVARRRLDKALDWAVRANGRLVLAAQRRYGVPEGGVSRADLVQGGALGARRGLMDYDPARAKPSTYLLGWIRQGINAVLEHRDVVGAPRWARELRGQVESRGVRARDLLRAVEVAAEAALRPGARQPRSPARDVLLRACGDLVGLLAAARVPTDGPPPKASRRPKTDVSAVPGEDAEAARSPDEPRASWVPALPAWGCKTPRRGPGHHGRRGDDCLPQTTIAALRLARALTATVRGDSPEKARERACAALLPVLRLSRTTGAGLLGALRHGGAAVVRQASGTDDRDEDDGSPFGAVRAAGGGGPGACPEVVVDPAGDEEAVAEEEVDRARWATLTAGLAALRADGSPGALEAAEVVRRHYGLDGADEESLAQVAEAPLRSTGRRLSREAVRQLCRRGLAALREYAAGQAGALEVLAGQVDAGAEDDWSASPGLRPRGPWRPLRPAVVVATFAASPPSVSVTPDATTAAASFEVFRASVDSVAW